MFLFVGGLHSFCVRPGRSIVTKGIFNVVSHTLPQESKNLFENVGIVFRFVT